MQELVKYLFDEATEALSNSLGPAKITAKGIETPLGVVTTPQIEKGEGTTPLYSALFALYPPHPNPNRVSADVVVQRSYARSIRCSRRA